MTLPEPHRVATYHWSMRSCKRIAVGRCVLRCAATLLAVQWFIYHPIPDKWQRDYPPLRSLIAIAIPDAM